MQHMESLKREVEKLKSEAKQGSSGRMLEEVDKYRKANDALHTTVARLEASPSYDSNLEDRLCGVTSLRSKLLTDTSEQAPGVATSHGLTHDACP